MLLTLLTGCAALNRIETRIGELNTNIAAIQATVGEINTAVTVGGDGDSITSWILAGGLTMLATILIYAGLIRPVRRRLWPEKKHEAHY